MLGMGAGKGRGGKGEGGGGREEGCSAAVRALSRSAAAALLLRQRRLSAGLLCASLHAAHGFALPFRRRLNAGALDSAPGSRAEERKPLEGCQRSSSSTQHPERTAHLRQRAQCGVPPSMPSPVPRGERQQRAALDASERCGCVLPPELARRFVLVLAAARTLHLLSVAAVLRPSRFGQRRAAARVAEQHGSSTRRQGHRRVPARAPRPCAARSKASPRSTVLSHASLAPCLALHLDCLSDVLQERWMYFDGRWRIRRSNAGAAKVAGRAASLARHGHRASGV
jgi:hypothetical protein